MNNPKHYKQFIWVKGEKTADMLEQAGLQLLYHDKPNNMYVFLNDDNVKFERNKTMTFTNRHYL